MTAHRADPPHELSRRTFFYGAAPLAASALAFAAEQKPSSSKPAPSKSAPAKPASPRKIKIGFVGQGGRGHWLAKLFQKHGGYQFHAVADYFPEVADRAGDVLGVDRSRRFSGLSGFKKVIDSGIEAIVLETPPYFFPDHARAAVAAGCHVYMAKPVAVDVPGCLAIEAAARTATEKKRCFFVDYQLPTDPLNIEVVQRIKDGALGRLAWISTLGFAGTFPDPPKTKTIESRLQNLTWVNDIALGGDYIVNFDIHAIDAALWVTGARPVAACGDSRITRPDPHGDSRDVCSVVYQFADGLVLNHAGQALKNNAQGSLLCQVFGSEANAQINYWGKSFIRGGAKHFGGGTIANLYLEGAQRNIASFHQAVAEGRFDNPTVRRAVDGALTTILGREAAARHTRLTMDELLKENKRLDVDLRGLKA
jgi:predicted dehydrogenase